MNLKVFLRVSSFFVCGFIVLAAVLTPWGKLFPGVTAINPPRTGYTTLDIQPRSASSFPSRISKIGTEPVKEPLLDLKRVGSFEKLLKLLAPSYYYNVSDLNTAMEMDTIEGNPAPTPMPAASSEPEAASRGADYSQTNVQVTGIDEGDVVKTDGDYIYRLWDNKVSIYSAGGDKPELLSTLGGGSQRNPNDSYVHTIYVSGDLLVTIANRYEEIPQDKSSAVDKSYWTPGKKFTVFTVYDIQDRSKPEVSRIFELEGGLSDSRLADGKLVFIVSKNVYYNPDVPNENDILPLYRDSAVGEGMMLYPAADCCYFIENPVYSFMLVGMFDITDDSPAVFECFLDPGGIIYMNSESLYIARSNWEADGERTAIVRFALTEDGLELASECETYGYIINQYAMDEYNGVFRIASTFRGEGNFITTFDRNLNLLGRSDYLSADETIQSVRFMGNICYMVTYRQTDPLYSIDLTDPENPVVLDALKIPGFSQYLLPISEGLLIGFGRHTTELYYRDDKGNEISSGTRDLGTKLSLFDISDPRNLKEIDVMLLGESAYSEVFSNPRALMVDYSRSQCAFFLEDYSGNNNLYAMVVSVSGGKLHTEGKITPSGDKNYGSWNSRLVYVGETLYAAYGDNLTAYDYETLLPK